MNQPDGHAVVGKDVSIYSMAPYGADQNGVLGTAQSLLLRFKEITVKFDYEWEDTTASSNGGLKERRKLNSDWSATCKQQIRSGSNNAFNGAVGMSIMDVNDMVQVVFTEVGTGKQWTLWGGFKSGEANYVRGEANETLEIINVGMVSPDGTGSAFYQ